MASETISREDLIARIDIGEFVHVSSEVGGLKFRSAVVGYSDGVLITSLPSPSQLNTQAPVGELFKDDMPLVMRLIVDGVVYAFKSQVRGINLKAGHFLFSSMPDKIQLRRLRSGVRYPCVLQAGLIIEQTKYRGVLINISQGGCLFQMKENASVDKLRAFREHNKMTQLSVRFPSESSDNSFDIYVKSVSPDSAGYLLVGVSFAEAGEAVKSVKKYLDFMQLEELSEYLLLN
jgi:c-di-GMP-binding flagellar brake protein YcgR